MSFTISTQQNLSNIHRQLTHMFNMKNAINKQDIADELEELLTDLKKAPASDEAWQNVKELVRAYSGFLPEKFFQHKGGTNFEAEFSMLIEALASIIVNKGNLEKAIENSTKLISYGKHGVDKIFLDVWTGQMRGTVQNANSLDKLPDYIIEELRKAGQNREVYDVLSRKTNQWVKRYRNYLDLTAKDIKTDVAGTAKNLLNLDLSWNATPKLNKLLQLLTSYNFSLKNYQDLSNIHVGDTNFFKAYSGVLSVLGYNADYIYNSFYRLLGCYRGVQMGSGHSGHGVIEHTGHIQTVYELIGMGIIYARGADRVDFIVINNPNGGINVFSTDYLAYEALSNRNNIIKMSSKRNSLGGGAVTISLKNN